MMEAVAADAQSLKGCVIVIRYERAQGRPGMKEMLNPTALVMGAGFGAGRGAHHGRPLLGRLARLLRRPRGARGAGGRANRHGERRRDVITIDAETHDQRRHLRRRGGPPASGVRPAAAQVHAWHHVVVHHRAPPGSPILGERRATAQLRGVGRVAFFLQAAARRPSGDYVTLVSRQTASIHPSSALFSRRAPCVLYNELVFTTRL